MGDWHLCDSQYHGHKPGHRYRRPYWELLTECLYFSSVRSIYWLGTHILHLLRSSAKAWTPSRLPLYFPVSVLELQTSILLSVSSIFRPGLQKLFQPCEWDYSHATVPSTCEPAYQAGYQSTAPQTQRLPISLSPQASSSLTLDYSPSSTSFSCLDPVGFVPDMAWGMTFSVLSVLSLTLLCIPSLHMEIFRRIILFRCLVLRLLSVPTEVFDGSPPITWQNRGNGNREEGGIMRQRLDGVLMIAWRRKPPYALSPGVLEMCP